MFSQHKWSENGGAAVDHQKPVRAGFHQKNPINGISSPDFKYSMGLAIQTNLVFFAEILAGY